MNYYISISIKNIFFLLTKLSHIDNAAHVFPDPNPCIISKLLYFVFFEMKCCKNACDINNCLFDIEG